MLLIRVPRRRPALALSAALAIGLLGACDASRPERTGPDGAGSGGPLRANLDGGGNALAAPERRTWSGTFGSLLLCVDAGSDVAIDSVEYHFRVRPQTVTSAIREVPHISRRWGPEWRWAPVIANRSTLKKVEDAEISATRVQAVAGARIDVPCDDRASAPYAELLTGMKVNSGGGWIDGIEVHYSVGEESFVLPVDWSYVACGDAIDDRRLCAAGREAADPHDSRSRPEREGALGRTRTVRTRSAEAYRAGAVGVPSTPGGTLQPWRRHRRGSDEPV